MTFLRQFLACFLLLAMTHQTRFVLTASSSHLEEVVVESPGEELKEEDEEIDLARVDSHEGRSRQQHRALGAFKTFGRFSYGCSGQTCRSKRSTSDAHLIVNIETDQSLFRSSASASATPNVQLRLKRSEPLLAPHYKLVVRDGDDKKEVNETVPYPNCLYEGILAKNGAKVSLSTCHQNLMKGVILSDDSSYVIEELPKSHPDYPEALASRTKRRPKREMGSGEDDGNNLVMIYETEASGGQCGINQFNLKRMKASEREIVLLNSNLIQSKSEPEVKGEEVKKDDGFLRKKRSASASIGGGDDDDDRWRWPDSNQRLPSSSSSSAKTIELAVFVDDEMYEKEKMATDKSNDPVTAIQDLVFTYLNSVQLLYNSRKLDTRFRLILVRLDIFRRPVSNIDKRKGDIESYLESFCRWQKDENPGDHFRYRGDQQDPDHWDHALMLTGLNLFDRQPRFDTVIGLAWVSGMCHPQYSCTINEGNNFESVYVIAHEMGHNLGMNHDGEANEGNHCDPDSFLMSPVLGPGKVTWSSCSNREITEFLTKRSTKEQSVCLNDAPPVMQRYNYLKTQKAPGELYKAIDQCKKAFGPDFIPHQLDEPPFEDLCRELWCANSTHALRSHPALEGTDCNSKPYPYGSTCFGGECVPFDPNNPFPNATLPPPTLPGGGDKETGSIKGPVDPDRPEWYDPIFTRIFNVLKRKYSEKYPSENGQIRMLPITQVVSHKGDVDEGIVFDKDIHRDDDDDDDDDDFEDHAWAPLYSQMLAKWVLVEAKCPVTCGGGWTNVTHACSQRGQIVDSFNCDDNQKPGTTKTVCNLMPCM